MDEFHACTYCGSTRFYDGPRGGACMNVGCVRCGARFNVLIHPVLPVTLPVMLIDKLSPPPRSIAGLFEPVLPHG